MVYHSPHQLIERQQNKNTVYNTARVIFITKQGTGTDISAAVSTGAFVDVSDVTCSFTGSTDANLWVEDGRLALFLLSLQWKKNNKPKYQGSGYSNWHWLNYQYIEISFNMYFKRDGCQNGHPESKKSPQKSV